MKKLALMLLGFAATINAMAVDYTAKAVVTLQSEAGYMCELTLRQADEYGALNGADLYMDGLHVALYAIKGTTPLQIAKATDLDGTKVGFMSDASTSYTLTVSSVEGAETLYLWDGDTKSYALTEGAVYNFTATANATDEDRFVIKKVPYTPAPAYVTTVTTNAYGLATFSYNQDLEAVENDVKLYKGDLDGYELVLSEVNYVKANQGVIVYGAPNTTYHFNVGNGGTSSFDGNELLPASAWDYAAQDGYSIYVLSGTMLYLYEGTDMKPNKAFLKVNQNPISGNAPARISMRFNGTQDVENAEAEDAKAVKFVENGQVFIRRGEAVYNLQGQKLR